MSFAWRREDIGYLGAALAAAAIVVYLMIGNFGLLPLPFTTPRANQFSDSVEPVFVASPPVSVSIPRVAIPDVPDEVPVAPVPAGDAAKPAVAISTEPGTSVAVAATALIEGLVRDADSGVEKVLVTFMSGEGDATVVLAELTCDDTTHHECVWRAKVPSALANTYTVTAQAVDRAGNTATSEPIDYAVVNAGGPVEQVTDVVERVPTVLNKLVGSVLGILGG